MRLSLAFALFGDFGQTKAWLAGKEHGKKGEERYRAEERIHMCVCVVAQSAEA
jgi:hypothetical protein